MTRMKMVVALGLVATVAAGCSSLRNAAGLSKKSPDEFAVTTKAPLVIPPDFNLRPPLPGAPPTNQLDPSDNAQQALFAGNADPQTVASQMTGNYSPGEKLLLANAGAQKTDPAIRARLNADQRATVQNANQSFTDRILASSATPDTGKPVNADAEVNKRAGRKTDAAATTTKDSGGGWFDWF